MEWGITKKDIEKAEEIERDLGAMKEWFDCMERTLRESFSKT